MVRAFLLDGGAILLVGHDSRAFVTHSREHRQGGDAVLLARELHELADRIAHDAIEMNKPVPR